MDNIISFEKPHVVEPSCSFCNRPKKDVKGMFSSPDGEYHICTDCIIKSKERLNESL